MSTASTEQQIHQATATVDRDGVQTDDGVIALRLAVAGEADDRDGVTSPEHLMAAALAGCLHQALRIALSAQNNVTGEPVVQCSVSLSSERGGGYSASFDLTVAGLHGDLAQQTLQQAQALCPFTKALADDKLSIHLS